MKEAILQQLADHPWAANLHEFPVIHSTNDEAKRLAAAGAPHGTVVIADSQTGGRGRMGRSFHSPAGKGIYLSVILRPECRPTELMHLTCAVGCAMCDAVEEAAGLRPGIKWINDLVYARKKLGGILVEMALSPAGNVAYAVVGIGINCCHAPEDFPPELQRIATSLTIATGRPVNRVAVAAAMIRHLESLSNHLLIRRDAIMARYRQDCITIGQDVSVHRFEQVRHGTALDVDEDGGLLVRFPDGHTETVSAGEVSVRGMYGYV